MSNEEFCFSEGQIQKAIKLLYHKKFGKTVSVKLNKKKKRENVKSKYEPFIDFTVVELVDICGIVTSSITTLDSDILKSVLSELLANEGILVNDVIINVNIDRKLRRKDNIIFENVRVLCDKEPNQKDLDSAANLNENDISKLNTSSIIFEGKEICKLIKEYFKEFEHRLVEVKYVPRKVNENYNFFNKETALLIDEEVESFSIKENDDERFDNHYFTITEYKDIEIITEETLQKILSKIFRAYGCELNSFDLYDLNSYFVNKFVRNDVSINHADDELRLYVNFTKKNTIKSLDEEDEIVNLDEYFDNGNCFEKLDSEDPDFDNDDYFDELREEKPKKLSFGTRIKNMFSGMRRR